MAQKHPNQTNSTSPSRPGPSPMPSISPGRTLPNARDLEGAVLGALMANGELAVDLHELLQPGHFYEPQHATIYAAIQRLVLDKRAVDLLNVQQLLADRGQLEGIGGVERLLELNMGTHSGPHAYDHARVLIRKFLQRQLIHIAGDLQAKSYDGEVEVDALMEEFEAKLFELHESGMRKEVLPAERVVRETLDFLKDLGQDPDRYSGVPSGFPVLDELTLGWQAGDLIILAARPSMGKTAMALTMARNMVVEKGKRVAFFSLEMSNLQLMIRLLVAETGIHRKMLLQGKLTPEEWAVLMDRAQILADAPLYLDDSQGLGVGELRAKARRLRSKYQIDALIVDYLQFLRAPALRNGTREQEVSMISRELKGLAKELNIPVIALAQLSRKLEQRAEREKTPILSDLRESGSIEQDADMVLFIHRPEKLGIERFPDGTSTEGKAQIIIAKNRNGEIGTVTLDFIGSQTKFVDRGDRVDHNRAGGDSFAPPISLSPQPFGDIPGVIGSKMNTGARMKPPANLDEGALPLDIPPAPEGFM